MEDPLVVIASYLRPEEGGMLRGLLESAGITAVVRDDMLSSVNPFLQPVIGGVKLAVRASEVERARAIVRAAGVLPGPGPDEPVEIPEEEWSAAPRQGGQVVKLVDRAAPLYRRPLVAVPLLAALLLILLRCVAGSAQR